MLQTYNVELFYDPKDLTDAHRADFDDRHLSRFFCLIAVRRPSSILVPETRGFRIAGSFLFGPPCVIRVC
jgi:hypothetical protein